jgi:hypothetical protein
MKKEMVHVVMLVLLSMTFSWLMACGGGGGSDTTDASWTYMVYMGADNDLSTAGLLDLNEMEAVGSDANVNIVLQAEFSLKYGTFLASNHPDYDGQTLRFLVTKDNDPGDINLEAGTPVGNLDMAAPETLSDFIVWATTSYPADHYALVIWDHGAGWKESRLGMIHPKGAVLDDTSGNFMTLPQLARGVGDAAVDLDIIDFDACLMGMYEVAYEFNGLTDYLVFSEEVEPGDGDPYDTILSALAATPSMSARTLSTTIADKYHEYYSSPQYRTDGITKSAVDMSMVDTLHTQIGRLADGIIGEYDTISSIVTAAQEQSQNYRYGENHDLHDFATHLATHLPSGTTKTAAAAVAASVTSMVVANRTFGDEVADSHGIAIYAPTNNQMSDDTASDDLLRYGQLACNASRASTWLDAVNKMTETSSDTILKSGGFAFYVTWDTDADVDLYVWEPCEPQVDRPCGETLFAPWMGQSTPNGTFSPDSYESGYAEEYYVANNYVEAGDYDILINYYKDGASDYADVTIWYIDPSQGVTEWTQVGGSVPMDLSNPHPSDTAISLDDANSYSDLWYPARVTRDSTENPAIHLLAGERCITIRINRKKTKPIAADTKR